MSTVLIIGGKGELGRNIYNVLAEDGGNTLTVSSRKPQKGEVYFDWEKVESFQKAFNFDFIINCSPVKNISNYFKFVEQVLALRTAFFETSAEVALIENIVDYQFQTSQPKGLYVHGVGIFPGISNLLCQKAFNLHPDAQEVRLNMKYNIFSQAGKDMCKLMAKSLFSPSFRFQNGQKIVGLPIGDIYEFKQSEKSWLGFEAALPDTIYLSKIFEKAGLVSTFFSPFGRPLFGMVKWVNQLGHKPWIETMLANYFYLLRGVIFKHRSSAMLLSLSLDGSKMLQISFKNGLRGAGICCSTLIEYLSNHHPEGYYSIEKVVEAEAFLNKICSKYASEVKEEA